MITIVAQLTAHVTKI